METEILPTFISLSEASERTGLSRIALNRAIKSDTLRAVKNERGGILVAQEDIENLITKEQFEHLRGQKLGIAEAGRKYGIPQPTLSRWSMAGYIKRLGRKGKKVLIDEADVAYCAAVYRMKDGGPGKRIFDDNGLPYRPKDPRTIATPT
jgi:predicted site-specific integrase-resolvase